VAGGHERLFRPLTQAGRDDAAHRGRAQRRRRERHGRRLADGVQEVLVGVGLARADRGQQQHGEVPDPTGEVGEKAQRRPVGPLQVVDGEQQRPVFGKVEDDPQQAVQRGEASLARRAGISAEVGEHPSCRLRDLARARGQLEELAHHAEPEVALQRAAARTQQAHVVVEAPPRLVEQYRFADAGRPFEQHYGAAFVLQRSDRLLDRGELAVAFQRSHERCIVFRLA
jgi:hypothetical protein